MLSRCRRYLWSWIFTQVTFTLVTPAILELVCHTVHIWVSRDEMSSVMLNVDCCTPASKLTLAYWLSKPASDDHIGQSDRLMVVCDWYGVNTGDVQFNMEDLFLLSSSCFSRISPSAHTGDQNLNCSIQDDIWFDLCAVTFPSLVFF